MSNIDKVNMGFERRIIEDIGAVSPGMVLQIFFDSILLEKS